jgi:hypothetical protein
MESDSTPDYQNTSAQRATFHQVSHIRRSLPESIQKLAQCCLVYGETYHKKTGKSRGKREKRGRGVKLFSGKPIFLSC